MGAGGKKTEADEKVGVRSLLLRPFGFTVLVGCINRYTKFQHTQFYVFMYFI